MVTDEPAIAEPTISDPTNSEPVDQIAPDVDIASILAGVAAQVAADPEVEAEAPIDVTNESVPDVAPDVGGDAEAEYTEDLTQTESEPVAAPAPIRARVIKMRREDFDRAIALGRLVENNDTTSTESASDESVAAEVTALAELGEQYDDMDFPESATESFGEDEIADDAADLDDLARLDGLASLSATSTLSEDDEADLLAELEAVGGDGIVGDHVAPELAEVDDVVLDATFEEEPVVEDAVVQDDPTDEAPVEMGFDEVTDAADASEADLDGDAGNDTDLALMNMLARVTGSDVADTSGQHADENSVREEASDGSEVGSDIDAVIAAHTEDDEDAAKDDLDLQLASLRDENLFADESADDEDADEAAFNAFADASDDGAAEQEPAVAHAHLRAEPEADEAALSRIMSEADAQLSEPEASRRREAIAQLRAAVAATEAARRLGETPVETDTRAEDAFRDDLQQVVRPRRPMTPTAEVRSERPRPAPLKLVASQRIDLPQTAPRNTAAVTMPIRPRRVTITPEVTSAPVALSPVPTSQSQATSFADFAAEMGATSLSDLLEAAAAYTAFVEKSEDFSRPQLLKKVTQLGNDQFSREDGLRSIRYIAARRSDHPAPAPVGSRSAKKRGSTRNAAQADTKPLTNDERAGQNPGPFDFVRDHPAAARQDRLYPRQKDDLNGHK